MKTILTRTVFTIFVLTLLASCKSTDPLVRQQKLDDIANKLEQREYTFEARSAQPMSAKVIQLTSAYTLKVSADTITAHLPYFGRVYSADMSSEGGIKFVSTDFTYEVSEKKKGTSRVSIEINDHKNKYKLSLLIGELGNSTLYVSQINKQSITFMGDIY